MKEYKKPEITILSFVSKQAISSGLSDWLATEEGKEFQDTGITSFETNSIG